MATTGINEIVKRLNDEIAKIQTGTRQRLARVGRLVKERSQARAPVDTGFLKSSHYNKDVGTKDTPVQEVGARADYAVPVHEITTAVHETGEAKFLENALRESEGEILDIISGKLRF